MAATSITADRLVPSTVAGRRRAGRGLLAFGVVGLGLLAVAAALVLGSLGALGTAATDLDVQRTRIVAMLPAAEAALEGAATSAANAGTSLETSSRAARDAADLVTQLAQAMDGMSAAARIDVFGVQPFEPLADDLAGVAERSRTLATDLIATAGTLDANTGDAGAAATDLRTLAGELAALRTELEAEPAAAAADAEAAQTTIGIARIVLLALLAWLAVPAIVATWLGWRWARG